MQYVLNKVWHSRSSSKKIEFSIEKFFNRIMHCFRSLFIVYANFNPEGMNFKFLESNEVLSNKIATI